MTFSTVHEGISDLKKGKLIILVDDESRENEGDFVMAAQHSTNTKINFMIKKGGGLVCMPINRERLKELEIPLMVNEKDNNEITRCNFTVSVDLKNIGTGISASNRSDTVKALIDPKYVKSDFTRPGHIFPLMSKSNGVLDRAGHTEASIDLCTIAGLYPGAVICEILGDTGEAAKLEELKEISKKHNLKIISIDDLLKYRKNKISTKNSKDI